MSAGDLHSAVETPELPVLFKTPLVEKILADLKTQTRRPVKDATGAFWDHAGYRPSVGPDGRIHWEPEAIGGGPQPRCPLGRVGTRLWVRETWQALVQNGGRLDFGDAMPPEYDSWWEAVETKDLEAERLNNKSFSLVYRAGADQETLDEIEGTWGWRPNIHMYRWACRLVLEVTDVRVERLQAMMFADLQAEGYPATPVGREMFAQSWDATYAKKGAGWFDNPWVWVADFKVVERPPSREDLAMTEEEKERFSEEFRAKVREMRERGDA